MEVASFFSRVYRVKMEPTTLPFSFPQTVPCDTSIGM